MIEEIKTMCEEQIKFLENLNGLTNERNISYQGMIAAYKHVLMEIEKLGHNIESE